MLSSGFNNNNSTPNILHKKATEYLSKGLCVLPAYRARKCPSISWKKHQNQLINEKELEENFNSKIDAIAIVGGKVSGNLEVLDFDNKGEKFNLFIEILISNKPELKNKLVLETTQSGGFHIYYRCEEKVSANLKLASRDKKVLIETRGEGGLIICSPTEGYNPIQGNLTELPLITIDERNLLINIAKSLNDDLEDKVFDKVPNSEENKFYDILPGTDFNERGDIRPLLIEEGWKLVRSGANEHWVRSGKESGVSATFNGEVFYVFSSNAIPFESGRGYSKYHAYTLLKCNSDFKKASRELAEKGYGQRKVNEVCPIDDSEKIPELVDPGLIPKHLLKVPGFIGDLSNYMYTTAPYPNLVMSFLGALALLSFLCGRLIKSEKDLRPNLYLLGLGHSSSGKDHPRRVNANLLRELNKLNCLGDSIASAEGLEDRLESQPCLLYQTDEVDGMLLAMKNSNKEFRHENTMNFMLKLYSTANSILPRRSLARCSSKPPIIEPHFTLFGTATPKNFYDALSEKMLTNGFFARMLVFESYPKELFNDKQIEAMPESILKVAKYWTDLSARVNTIEKTSLRFAYHNEASRKLSKLFAQEADNEYRKCEEQNDNIGTTVWGRANENALKLSMLYAASKDPHKLIIDEEATKWSIDVVNHLVRKMLFNASKYSSDSKANRNMMRLLDMVPRAKNGIPRSTLLKKSKLEKKDFDALMETLLERGDVSVENKESATKKGVVYKLA